MIIAIELTHTSVTDAKSSLECTLANDPARALADATATIDYINEHRGPDGQKSRLAMLTAIVNKARKALRN
ncbi:hypothetical protein ACW5WQ_20320 [Aeromonas rivuli]|uniref:hypothetical protein n=1 Tax=Aeromonas rivuli TaxID=648794 RepID=UPI0005A890B7|nr:hypothetical protein [Aeromonas rivuli]